MSETGIYKITSPNGAIYIGQSVDIKSRWRGYKCALAKGQPKLRNSFLKYGYDNHTFEILEYINGSNINMEKLNEREIYFYNLYTGLGYRLLNVQEAGTNGRRSAETKLKISLSKKGKPSKLKGIPKSKESIEKAMKTKRLTGVMNGKIPWNKGMSGKYGTSKKGVPVSKDAIKKQIETKIRNGTLGKGRVHSVDWNRKIGDAQRGIKSHSFGRAPWNKGMKTGNKSHTSFKKNMIPWNKGVAHTDVHKDNLKKAWADRKNKKKAEYV